MAIVRCNNREYLHVCLYTYVHLTWIDWAFACISTLLPLQWSWLTAFVLQLFSNDSNQHSDLHNLINCYYSRTRTHFILRRIEFLLQSRSSRLAGVLIELSLWGFCPFVQTTLPNRKLKRDSSVFFLIKMKS